MPNIICKGYPSVYVKSLNRTFKKDEVFFIEEENISEELRGKIKMGLFDYIAKGIAHVSAIFGAKSTPLFRNRISGGDTTKRPEQTVTEKASKTEGLDMEALKEVIRQTIREEMVTTRISGTKTEYVKKTDVEGLSESAIFIRPEEKDFVGDVQIEGVSEENSSVEDAISKLKGKKNGKK